MSMNVNYSRFQAIRQGNANGKLFILDKDGDEDLKLIIRYMK
jgi:hypothetical protein